MIKIKFEYREEAVSIAVGSEMYPVPVTRRTTKCRIEGYSASDYVRTGVAIFNPSDSYNKLLGRKIAFTRALGGLTKDHRTKLWKQFLETHRI